MQRKSFPTHPKKVKYLQNLVPKNVKKKNISLSSVLYGCETWFPPLKEEQRLVFKSKMLKKTHGSHYMLLRQAEGKR